MATPPSHSVDQGGEWELACYWTQFDLLRHPQLRVCQH